MTKRKRTEMSEAERAEAEELRDGDTFMGTAAIYVAGPKGIREAYIGNYEVNMMLESSREELRAYRQRRRREGKPVPRLSKYALRDEAIIIFGPLVSQEMALSALKRAFLSIKGNGLLIGRDAERDFVWEWAEDGTIVTSDFNPSSSL